MSKDLKIKLLVVVSLMILGSFSSFLFFNVDFNKDLEHTIYSIIVLLFNMLFIVILIALMVSIFDYLKQFVSYLKHNVDFTFSKKNE